MAGMANRAYQCEEDHTQCMYAAFTVIAADARISSTTITTGKLKTLLMITFSHFNDTNLLLHMLADCWRLAGKPGFD